MIRVTGIDQPDVAIECIRQGARTYLVRPVDAGFLALPLRTRVFSAWEDQT